jgi:NDP-sugar pyrophosphorylase family protein
LVNRPLVEHQLQWLRAHGARHAAVAFDGELGLPASDGSPLVVLPGDVLAGCDLTRLLRHHHRSGALATVVYTGEIPVAYVLEDQAWRGRRMFLDTDPLSGVPAGSVRRVESTGYAVALRTADAYIQAHVDVLEGRLSRLPGNEIAPGVWSAGSVSIHPGSIVRGPVLLGRGTVIEDGAIVERASLGAGCLVAAGAVVDRSVLLDGARVGAGGEVFDSVLGPGAAIGENSSVSRTTVVGPKGRVVSGVRLCAARVG